MSSNAPSNNSKRNARQSGVSPSPDTPASSTPGKSKKKTQNYGAKSRGNGNTSQEAAMPFTPAREPTQSNMLSQDAYANNSSDSVQSKNRNRRKGNTKNAQDTPRSRQSHSPRPEPAALATAPVMTPAKPTQIYAGPTFHASPAASALPIPKLFFKSMPQVNDKNASLKAMMHDLSESSSSNEEDSPTLRNAVRAEEPNPRNESPLDIFFKADREEKARLQLGSPNSNLSTPNANSRAQSASPSARPLYPSRQSAENTMFPLEMDSNSREKAFSPGLECSPTIMISHDQDRVAEAKAKTEALKQLLLFPKAQQQDVVGDPNSPTPSNPRPNPGARTASDSPKGNNSFYISPYTTMNIQPRSSSSLRQELVNDASRYSGPPTPTPTPTRIQSAPRANPRPNAGTNTPNSSHVSSRSLSSFQAEDALRASLGNPSNGTASAELMEEQLRKILKLDTLPRTGVRS